MFLIPLLIALFAVLTHADLLGRLMCSCVGPTLRGYTYTFSYVTFNDMQSYYMDAHCMGEIKKGACPLDSTFIPTYANFTGNHKFMYRRRLGAFDQYEFDNSSQRDVPTTSPPYDVSGDCDKACKERLDTSLSAECTIGVPKTRAQRHAICNGEAWQVPDVYGSGGHVLLGGEEEKKKWEEKHPQWTNRTAPRS